MIRPKSLPAMPADNFVSLATTSAEELAAKSLLERAGIDAQAPLAILNPGGNNPIKRWPADRFAQIARELDARGLKVLVNGSPAEAELCAQIATMSGAVDLPRLGNRIGTLKSLIRRARLLLTNDTGPRYFALAFNTPCVALYGPTDVRWTLTPARNPSGHIVLRSNPELPTNLVADDYPEECCIEKITVESVRAVPISLSCAE